MGDVVKTNRRTDRREHYLGNGKTKIVKKQVNRTKLNYGKGRIVIVFMAGPY
jgi:hypothetical protein